ncbi:MAG: DUF3168 domain-containing protein [Planctomycetaceae bacterium]
MLEIDIIKHLSDDSDISNLVDDRVYPHHIPQISQYPCLTVQLIDAERIDCLSRPSGIAIHVYQIDAWSDSFDDVITIAEIVRTKLQGYIGEMVDTTVYYSSLIDEKTLNEPPVNASDDWVFRKMLRYKIKFQENV